MLDHFLGVRKFKGVKCGGGFEGVGGEVDDELEAVVVFEGVGGDVDDFAGGNDGDTGGHKGGELLAGIKFTDFGKP